MSTASCYLFPYQWRSKESW